MSKFLRLVLSILTISVLNVGRAQQVPPGAAANPARDSTREIHLIRSDVLLFKKKDSNDLQILVGNVMLFQGKTFFQGDSVSLNNKLNTIEAFGNIHINDGDSVHIYGQYLIYYGNTKTASVKKNVKLTDGKATLTTEALDYDLNSKIGTYRNGGKVVNATSTLTSEEGYYYADTRDAYFKKNVKLVDPQYTMATDTLLYNANSQIATFVAPTTINDGKSIIRTSSGYYDLAKGLADFGSRPVIEDSTQYITADHIVFDKITGKGHAEGKFFYRDTTQGVTVLSEVGDINRNEKTFLATVKPVMIIRQDNDSLYVTGDTLYSGIYRDSLRKLNKELVRDTVIGIDSMKANASDSIRFFQAFHHVRIFSDSMQAVGDSMFYSFRDSVFRLYKDPVMWSRGSQLSGDTIYLFTKNKKPDRVEVFENAFAISKSNNEFFNQVKGNSIFGYFQDGEINYIRARGSAESLYYLQDEDSAYTGANYARADLINMYLEKRELKKITWVNEVEGGFYPVRMVPQERKIFRNFKWQEDRRPKTRLELFE
jgi:lipopolysaccharide export system protein LptA